MMDDILQFADKRALTTGKVAWPAPKGPSTQHSSDRYLRKESRDFFFWIDDICIKVRCVRTWLRCWLGDVELQKNEMNKAQTWANKKERQEKKDVTSPELAAYFSKEEADHQQTEGGWSAENTRSVVMQILPQTTCKSLGEKEGKNGQICVGVILNAQFTFFSHILHLHFFT